MGSGHISSGNRESEEWREKSIKKHQELWDFFITNLILFLVPGGHSMNSGMIAEKH